MISNYHVQFFKEETLLTCPQLMQLGWKSFLPVSISLIIVVSSFLILCNGLPNIMLSL